RTVNFPATDSVHRYPSRHRNGDNGARSCARLLSLRGLARFADEHGHYHTIAVFHEMDHALLCTGVCVPCGNISLPDGAAKVETGVEPVPPHTRHLAGVCGSGDRYAWYHLRSAISCARVTGDLGYRNEYDYTRTAGEIFI